MTEENSISYGLSEINGWTVWSVKGALSMITSKAAGIEGEKVLSGSAKMALDMSELEYLSSAGLRVILCLAKKAQAEGRQFALCAPQGRAKQVLRESRMDMLIKTCQHLEELERE